MNNLGSAWASMKTIVGLEERGRRKLEFYPGPDNISGRSLNVCAEQLGPIFYHIFSLALTAESAISMDAVCSGACCQGQSPPNPQ